MTNPFFTGVGAVLSADIAVPDHEREKRFYASVLTTGENPLWREDGMNNLGIPIIGLGERTEEHASLPIQWMPHIQVADVAASTQRAVELGGRVLMDSGDGQWAVLADPNGAAFGIIPVVPGDAIPPVETDASPDEPAAVGRIYWLDLTISDAGATRDFYQQVVGWSVQEVAMKDGDDAYADYAMLREDGDAAAGVCHARGGNAGLPPVWLIYLPVGDLAESLRRVTEEGGKILKAVKGKDGETAYAFIQDPVGASLALMPG